MKLRSGFTLLEVLLITVLLGICAMGVTGTWQFCYTVNVQSRQMQATKNAMELEMERVRRLNWVGLTEQTSLTAQYNYDRYGNPVGAAGSSSAVTGGYVSYLKIEMLQKDGAYLAAASGTLDATGGTLRRLRRVTVVLQPTGVAATTTPPSAQTVTYLTLGGP